MNKYNERDPLIKLKPMALEFHIPMNERVKIKLPIIECEIPDPYGYFIIWESQNIDYSKIMFSGKDNSYFKNYKINDSNSYVYEPMPMPRNVVVHIFGFGIKRFGFNDVGVSLHKNNPILPWTGGEYLTKVISFGEMGHNFVSLRGAFHHLTSLRSISTELPSTVTDISYMFSLFGQKTVSPQSGLIGLLYAEKGRTDDYELAPNCTIDGLSDLNIQNVTNFNYMFIYSSIKQKLNWEIKYDIDADEYTKHKTTEHGVVDFYNYNMYEGSRLTENEQAEENITVINTPTPILASAHSGGLDRKYLKYKSKYLKLKHNIST